jgi:hypothetical protein
MKDCIRPRGIVTFEVRGPNGKLKDRRVIHNLITDVGDAYLAQLAYGTKIAAGLNAMKLGTATTAVTKNGAGSFVAVADYISGSAHATDASSPKVGAAANVILWQHTWAAGEATNATINRVGLVGCVTSVDDAGEADATRTWAIALLPDKPINKGASDTLLVTWNVTLLGA